MLLFVLFYVLFVCKCVLPPGDNPTAVNKCIIINNIYIYIYIYIYKCKAVPLEAWTGPESFSRLRLPDFKTVGT